MLSLGVREAMNGLFVMESTAASVRTVDCGRFSPDNTRPECEDRADTGIGIFVAAAVLLLAVGLVAWRLMLRRIKTAPSDDERPESR
ncbi:hypothetical protein [Nocardioides iriomotensis]|uniref:Uncharacterized protein n=1 Tax=Nocardioides iriomotensis TaxID=715784 RepID=A0A4Q5IWY2_9ACTN|nr:hypothetical protein [Nocardioides iriomotensis]RYU09445.1 hypothetical protein ETU37_20500 [Nocardioides iriomotensis]